MSVRTDRFTAVLDTNVLAGALPRNILLSLAEAEFFRPRWSAEILDEFVRQFERRFGDPEGAARQRSMMERAFPAAVLARYDIEPVGLDDFIADILDLAGSDAVAALRMMRKRVRQPPITASVLIRKIEQLGLTQTADLLTSYEDLL